MLNARAAATDSVNDISAIPSAAGHSSAAAVRSGKASAGSPDGTAPTCATPRASRPSTAEAAMLSATQTRGAESRGKRRGTARRTATPARATSTVTPCASGSSRGSSSTVPTVVLLVTWTPSTDFNCPTMMTTPTPASKPTSTGFEMKLARNPSRSSRATIRTPPTSRASVAATAGAPPPAPLAERAATWAAVNIARADVVVTLSGRELPSRGYTTMAASAVYRPASTLRSLATLVGVIVMGTLEGILIAVAISILTLFYQANHPPVYAVAWNRAKGIFRRAGDDASDETFPGLLMLRTEGRLTFANAANAGEKMQTLVVETEPRVIVLECSAIPDIEYTALVMLTEAEENLRARGVSLWLAAVNPDLLKLIERSPLGAALGRERMFFTLHKALEAWRRSGDGSASTGK